MYSIVLKLLCMR